MRYGSDLETGNSLISLGRTMFFALFACALACTAQAQSNSIADAARQARADKQSQPAAEGTSAQQLANELSEDQNQKNVVAGLKIYDAGAYKLMLAAPYSMTGHDDGGVVISGPRVGTVVPLTLVGNALILHGDSDDAFHDASLQFVRNYLESAKCTQTTVANHNAYQCMLSGANLAGHSVVGGAMFIRDGRNVYPLFCVSTMNSFWRDVVNNPHATYLQKLRARQIVAQEDEYSREVWQKCDAVYQSVQFVRGGQPPMAVSAKADPQALRSGAGATQEKPQSVAAGSGPASLADVARQVHQSPQAAQLARSSNSGQASIPAGFKAQAFNYCKGPTNCWDASVLVPAEARLVSSDCKQYIFELTVKGSPFLLLAGPAGGEGCSSVQGDPNRVRWSELAAPENKRATGTYSTIGTLQTNVDGKPAIITQLSFRKEMTTWFGKRADIDSNGIILVVGCLAPKDTFDEGEAICSNWVGSVRLP